MKEYFNVDLVVLGIQGAGKGTQVAKLWGKFGKDKEWFLIQTGNLFRSIAKEDSEIGRKVKSFIGKGMLVPDEITNEVVFAKLSRDDIKEKNWIFDGFPRNIFQAEKFLDFYRLQGRNRLVVLFLDLPYEEALKRVRTRLVCRSCNAIANENFGLKEGDKCKHCGGVLHKREDEKDEQAIETRFKIFVEKTLPIYEFFEKEGIHVERIDATPDIKTIHRNILKLLNGYWVG